MVVLGVWGKFYCVCVVVIYLRYMLDLLWEYPVPNKPNPLGVLLDSTCNFRYLAATGSQDLYLSDQDNLSVGHGIGKTFNNARGGTLLGNPFGHSFGRQTRG